MELGAQGSELPASVRLFLDRARLARPDFNLTESNREDVFRLCTRLDGLPLALELAAARVRLFSPAQILADLGQPHPLDASLASTPTSLDWTNQDRAAPSRHSSLRAAIHWSQRQLTPTAARFWAGLSVFRGGWTLDAAAYVCSENDAASHMLALRDVSLISLDTRGETPRGSQLEVLREYAAGSLTPLDRAVLAERHARYFLDFAESIALHLNGPRGPRLLARFEAEHDNLRAAIEWHLQHDVEGAVRFAGALWFAWELRGHMTEGLMVLSQILDTAQHVFPEADAQALQNVPGARERLNWLAHSYNGAGKLATVTSNLETARDYYQKALRYFGTLQDDVGIADTLFGLGYTHLRDADLDGARQLCDQSIQIYRTLGEEGKRKGLCDALNNRALVAIYDGDFEMVWALNEEQLAIHRAAGEKRGIAVSLENLGLAALFGGEMEAAGAYFRESLAIFESIDELRSAARVLWGLGHVARAASQEAEAVEAFSRGLRLARDTQTLWTLPYLIEAFAYMAAHKNQLARATRLASGAALLRETHHEPMPRLTFLQEFDSVVAGLSESLGRSQFESEWMLGRSLSREALIALALQEQG
jgi:tetratricopeptide (TPR) repeat protein